MESATSEAAKKANAPVFGEIYAEGIITSAGIGNIVYDTAQDEDLTTLLFGSAMEAGRSPRREYIFVPVPPAFLLGGDNATFAAKVVREYTKLLNDKGCRRPMEKFNKLITEDKKNYALLDEIIKFIDGVGGTSAFVSCVRLIADRLNKDHASVGQDSVIRQELYAKFGDNGAITFDFMKFSLMNNKLRLQRNDMILGNGRQEGPRESMQISAKEAIKFHQYEVAHTKETEMEFSNKRNTQGSCFLYHGSGRQNWYSLMCNGIKVASNTKLMTAGAAYGVGIYLSNELSFSLGYSSYIAQPFPMSMHPSKLSAMAADSAQNSITDTAQNSITDTIIVAVYEVIGKPDDYKKTANIYVVPDDSLLIIRYLVALPMHSASNTAVAVSKQLLEIFGKRSVIAQTQIKKTIARWHSRVKSDIKHLAAIGSIKHSGENFTSKDYKTRIRKHEAPHTCEFEITVKSVDDFSTLGEVITTIIIKFPLQYPTCPVQIVKKNGVDVHSHTIKKVEWSVQSNLNDYLLNIIKIDC